MGVEVVSVGGAEAATPAKEVSAKAEVVAVAPGDAAVAKNPSFREESNRLGDLKDGERKALAELRAKVEEAIVAGTLFDEEVKVEAKKKVEPKKEGKKKAKKAEEKKEEEAKVEAPAAEENKEEEAKVEEEAAVEKKEEEAKAEEPEEKKEEAAAEEKKEEAEAEEKKEEAKTEDAAGAGEKVEAAAAAVVVDKDVALWGVPLLPSKGDEATDGVLLKFLRARDFKAGAAFEMLRKTLRWRREWKSLAATAADDGGATMPEGACDLDGVDREGHPVCYNALGVFADDAVYREALGDDEGKARFLRWRVRAMESHVAELDFTPGGVASLLQVTDLRNSPGPAKKDLRVAMRQVVDLFQDNYPELVARNILINAHHCPTEADMLVTFMDFKTEAELPDDCSVNAHVMEMSVVL